MYSKVETEEGKIRKAFEYFFNKDDYEMKKINIIVEYWRGETFRRNNKELMIDNIETKKIISIVNKTFKNSLIKKTSTEKLLKTIGINKSNYTVENEETFKRYIIAIKDNSESDVTYPINSVVSVIISNGGTIDDIVKSLEAGKGNVFVNGEENTSLKEKAQERNSKKFQTVIAEAQNLYGNKTKPFLEGMNSTLNDVEKIEVVRTMIKEIDRSLLISTFGSSINHISLGGND